MTNSLSISSVRPNSLLSFPFSCLLYTSYVKQNGKIDKEAYERGTSVYLGDRVVPMLPERLSNGICSLHPHEDRLTVSAVMEVDGAGKVVDYKIGRSVICSSERMTYQAVTEVLEQSNPETCQKLSLIHI